MEASINNPTSPPESDLNAQAIVEAVQLANELRGIRPTFFGKKEEPIVDLPSGVPGDEAECVLARAFNFNCRVMKMMSGHWAVRFPKDRKKYAKKLAKLLGSGARYDSILEAYDVLLPSHIGRIAQRFDEHNLDKKYYE